MIATIVLKKQIPYPPGFRDRVAAFNRALATDVPLDEFGKSLLAAFGGGHVRCRSVETPPEDFQLRHDMLIAERDRYHEHALLPHDNQVYS